jgi:hypothetical protein
MAYQRRSNLVSGEFFHEQSEWHEAALLLTTHGPLRCA